MSSEITTAPENSTTTANAQDNSLQNHFLISMPQLQDANFHRAVVLICKHDDSGAVGIVVNRTRGHSLSDIFQHLQIAPSSSRYNAEPVLDGGPVSRELGLVIHNDVDTNWESSFEIGDKLKLTSSKDIISSMASGIGPENMIMSLGYAGWGPGQLENEIQTNSWLTTAVDQPILFSTDHASKWSSAAALLGIDINLLSTTAGHA